MISTITPDTYKQTSASSQPMLPAAPFPRKYIHSVFDDQQDALQAAQSLRAAGYDAGDIHVLANHEYAEAVVRGQTLMDSLSSDLDQYMYESSRGLPILAVRISRYEEMQRVRSLLAPHHAHHMKYIDTWTVAHLIP